MFLMISTINHKSSHKKSAPEGFFYDIFSPELQAGKMLFSAPPMRLFGICYILFVLSLAGANLRKDRKPAPGRTKETQMFQGLRTVIYHVDDLQRAKEWYSKVLSISPYFDQPFYVGFNVGGFELGLDPDMEGISKGSNVVAYWGVKDARAACQRIQELGATKHSDPQEVGGGIVVATVMDPFGNVFGIIENPNFKVADGE
jgi:predicted enzyme related to lactoylglutathione lyase